MTDSKIDYVWKTWVKDEFTNKVECKFNKVKFNWPSGYELWSFFERHRVEAGVRWDFIDIDDIVKNITLQDLREILIV